MEISNAAADQLAEVIASYVNDNGDDRVQLIGEVLGEDSSGTTWVHILGGEQRTPVTSTNAKVHKGDIVYVVIGDGRADILGNVSRPSTDDTLAEVVQQRVVETERVVERIEATAITADSAEIQQLNADHAVIEALDSTYASIDNLNAATARIGNIEADYLVAADMTAEQARVGQLMAGKADVADLTAANGRIDILESTKADISFLESDYITADAIDATYLHADMSNADVAWIQNGVIKDAAISDAQIIGVSANKLTAGTIDASNINVTNLRADNLKVTRINGQPVIGGYALVDPSSSGYSSKNPKAQGWYELSGSSYVATNDTSVVSGKNYYSTSDYAELYDQDAIDGMVDSLNNRIDAQIETWTTDAVPTLNNYPASSWTTSDARAEHVGDICYVMNAGNDYDGYTYRFAYDNSTSSYKWVLIKDNQVTAALGRISDLETFESETSTWIDETDEGLRTIRSNHTTLAGRVDKVVKSSVQLWYTKANETAPSAPSSAVTSTSTSGNGWRTVVPTYNSSYPFYFYCWQYQYEDGTYDWSAVVYDRATSESEERARTGVANAASAQTTANANIKSSVQLWFTKANDTAPSKPSGTNPITVSDASKRNQWNLVVPTYSDSYPYYFYCYQQQKGDNTYQWTDVVYDEATSTAMKKAQGALPSSTFATFEQTTFKEVVDEVDEQSTKITTLTTITENNGLTETTNISNTVNQVSQTASGNSAKLSNITETIGANADGTNPNTKSIIARTSAVEQTLEGFQTTVTNVQRTAEEANDRGVAYSGTSSTGASTADKVAACTNFELVAGATVTVRFSAANTSTGAITLNVNNTGKRTVYVNGAATSSSNQLLWGANANVTFTYDGSYWRIVSEPRPWVGSCSVAAGTAAKTATINEVVICKGTSVTLNMTYSNTSTSATLNVTSTGAKNIYYGTTSTRPTTENGYGWTDASTQTFVFDGAYWRIGDTSALAGLATANGILSSHTSQISQNAQNIEMKANSSEVYTKTQTDGLITSEVEARNAAIKVSADSITQRVSEEYATKSALDTTNEKIDNLEIGGRNLVTKASRDGLATNEERTYSRGGRICATNIIFEDRSLIPERTGDTSVPYTAERVEGAKITLSFDYKLGEGGVSREVSVYPYQSTGLSVVSLPDAKPTNEWKKYVGTTHVYRWTTGNGSATSGSSYTPEKDGGTGWRTNGEIWIYDRAGANSFIIKNVKIEKGDKATDWTPAPEDLESTVTAIESRVSTAEASITNNAREIEACAKSTDVYTKQESDGLITSEVEARDAAIRASAEAISVSVSREYVTNQRFDNLEIGGRNLSPESLWENGFLQNSNTTELHAEDTHKERTSGLIPVTAGDLLTFQAWVDDTTGWDTWQPWLGYRFYSDESTPIGSRAAKYNTTKTNYVSYIGVEVPSDATLVRFSWRHYGASRSKLEKGNKPTDWSPAPEDLEGRMSHAETRIDQNAEAITFSATKSEASQMARPNLAPIGSVDFSSVYNATTSPNGYWRNTPSPWFTKLEDGWVHCYRDNTSGTAAANTTSWRPSPSPSVEAGKVYTILTEIRNNHSSGSSQTDMYLQQIANNQFWGDINGATIDDDHVTTTTNISLRSCGETYVRYSYRIADTEHLTTAPVELFRYNFRLPAGGKFDFDFRQSVYEGIYDGPYKPYVGQQLYASKAELKVATDGITSTVSSIASAKYVNANAVSWPLASLKTYAAEGHSENWNVTSTDGLRVGDTVYVKGTDGTRSCTVYIKTTVTAINSATNFTGTSHGYEDVLPVDTIKSTINQSSDSVKIQARHVEIDGEAIFSSIKDDVANQTALEHSSSGTSIAMDDAATASLKALTIYGKSVQDGTPTPSAPAEIQSVGAVNLLDYDAWKTVPVARGTAVWEDNGVTLTATANDCYTDHQSFPVAARVPVIEGETVWLTWDSPDAVSGNVFIFGNGGTSSMTSQNNVYHCYAYYHVPSGITYVTFRFGVVTSGTTIHYRNIRLTKSGPSQFAPYGSLGLWTHGKNLARPHVLGAYARNGVTFSVSGDGTITATGTATANNTDFTVELERPLIVPEGTTVTMSLSGTTSSQGPTVFLYDGSYFEYHQLTKSATYTLAGGRRVWYLLFRFNPSYGAQSISAKLQIEVGEEATEFAEFVEYVTPIPFQGHQLRSLPDGTRDELTVDTDGHVTMVQRVGSIDFDGSSDETWGVENGGARVVSNGVTNLKFQSSNSETFNALSNRFVGITPNNTWAGTMVGTSGNTSTRRLYFSDGTKAMDATAWRTWLTTNPTTVLFPYETPQTIDIGTIDMPEVHDGNTVEVIAALTPSIDATWWSTSGQVVADNVTIIDGGRIRTGSVTANQIAAGTITGNEIAGGTITSDNIETGTISADRLDANALTVGNIAGLEDKLETITNGLSSLSNNTQWVHFDAAVGTVFGDADSVNNVTVRNDGVYFNTEGGEAARASAGIFYSNEMQANDSISTPILKMGNWALVQSGTTFSIEYLG